MTSIARPTKLGGGPNVVAGNDILASEWNGDLNTIYDDYNGLIDDSNISPTATIQGSKIADAPNGIPLTKMNDDSVDARVLKDSASTDTDRAVTSDHIRNNAITTLKIADAQVTVPKLAAGFSLGTDKLKITIHAVTVTTSIGGATDIFTSGFSIDSGTNWAGTVSFGYKFGGSNVIVPVAANPTSTFAKATYDLIGLYIKNQTYTAGVISATLVYVFLTKVS